jgi:hypothetical protein
MDHYKTATTATLNGMPVAISAKKLVVESNSFESYRRKRSVWHLYKTIFFLNRYIVSCAKKAK